MGCLEAMAVLCMCFISFGLGHSARRCGERPPLPATELILTPDVRLPPVTWNGDSVHGSEGEAWLVLSTWSTCPTKENRCVASSRKRARGSVGHVTSSLEQVCSLAARPHAKCLERLVKMAACKLTALLCRSQAHKFENVPKPLATLASGKTVGSSWELGNGRQMIFKVITNSGVSELPKAPKVQ